MLSPEWMMFMAGTVIVPGTIAVGRKLLQHDTRIELLDLRTATIQKSLDRLEEKQDAMYLYLISNNPKKDVVPPPTTPSPVVK